MIAGDRVQRPRTFGLVFAVVCLFVSTLGAQENARIATDAYIYLYPDSTRKPFAKVEADSFVTIHGAEGDWLNISLVDSKGERRYGYVRQRAVQRLPPTIRTSPSLTPNSNVERSVAPESPSTEPSSSLAPRFDQDTRTVTLPPSRGRDTVRLQDVRRIFIEPMPNDLDQYISAEITKEFKGQLVVVLKKESADAVLRGSSESKTGVGAAITGRYLGLHDNASGSVSLVDRDETVVLWASEAGDRSLWKGILARGGQRKVAERLVNNLKKALTAH